MSITKRRIAAALSAVLLLAVIISAFSIGSVTIADTTETNRTDYSPNFTSGGFTHESKFENYNKTFIIDVSSHQSKIDWAKVYAAGIDGVMIRIGYRGYKYGALNSDSSFEQFYNGAKAAGLKVGVYFYGQPDSAYDAELEATYALGLLNGRTLDLPFAYDLEYATNDDGLTGRLYEADFTAAQLTTVANRFCNKVKNAGYDAMVYTSCNIITKKMNQSSLLYPVWLARYNSYVDYTCSYVMWQYTSSATVDGVSGECDMSVLYTAPSADDPTSSTEASQGDVSTTNNSSDASTTVTQPEESTTQPEETTTPEDPTGTNSFLVAVIEFFVAVFTAAFKYISLIFGAMSQG